MLQLTDKTAANCSHDGDEQKEEAVIVWEQKTDQLNPR